MLVYLFGVGVGGFLVLDGAARYSTTVALPEMIIGGVIALAAVIAWWREPTD